MRLLFVSNYFPPEVNAPATRLYEHARQWIADGHDVEVLTSVPNFPEGEVYEGYRNSLTYEKVDGIEVTRVPMYVAQNAGTVRRTLSYVSFMLSACWYSRHIRARPDVVVATSPQFFCGIGGYLISKRLGTPFILEVRDLWPESIVAVGAMERNAIIKGLEKVEHFLYRQADHIVVVTDAFKRAIAEKGIPSWKISVLKNGADLSAYDRSLDESKLHALEREHALEGKFVVSYIGTIGMAHRVDVLLEAAQRCDDPDIVFMVVGTGSEREALEKRQRELQLPNFRLVEKQPKRLVPYLLALSGASVVHLRASPLFRTVIPSKMFEAMAMRRPIILGVEGESKEMIEEAGAGATIPPEDPKALAEAAQFLKDHPEKYEEMAHSAKEYVHRKHDRKKLARRYWDLLQQVA